MPATYECDLHTHTNRSDGNDTYAELIKHASVLGIRILAITDHDMVPSPCVEEDGEEIPVAEYGRRFNVNVIPGIEFSCETYIDDVHILGYGCDFTDPLFARERALSDQSKINAYKELLELLTARGMPASWEEVINDAPAPRREDEVQRKHIFELLAKKGYAPTWTDAKLMVIGDDGLNVRRRKPAPADIIKLLHNTGGIAVLAHPYLIREIVPLDSKQVTRGAYIDHLISAGLDGIEAAYPYGKTSYGGVHSADEIESLVRSAYGNVLPVISGGSDYHNEAKKRLPNPRLLGEKGVSEAYFYSNPLLSRLI